jgi:hypothetical protein
LKLLYTIAFALLPLTALAQTHGALLLTALCHDDYFEDTAGQCRSLTAKEDLTIEEILAHYGEIISSDVDDESIFYFADPGDVPVGAIRPRQETPSDDPIAKEDDDRTADLTKESTVAAQSVTIEFSHVGGEQAVPNIDEFAASVPSPAGILTDEDRTVE